MTSDEKREYHRVWSSRNREHLREKARQARLRAGVVPRVKLTSQEREQRRQASIAKWLAKRRQKSAERKVARAKLRQQKKETKDSDASVRQLQAFVLRPLFKRALNRRKMLKKRKRRKGTLVWVLRKRIAKHRQRLRAATGQPTPDGLRFALLAILKAQDNRCVYCRVEFEGFNFEIDHRLPLSRGGTNDPANLQFTCNPCNWMKGDRTHEEYAP